MIRSILLFAVVAGFNTLFGQDPVGEIKGPIKLQSKIYPGTERDYWLYIPRQYNSSKATPVIIVQDGLSRATGWRLPGVLDSMIARNELPPMIGIFVDHGKVMSGGTDNYPRYNRSFEYDALGDRYARFLVDELLPEVNKSYNISKNPDDRMIAGASSGAIAAFNAAWERPDQFRRVLSTIGTYVGLRGGDEFATLVRKTEPKPLRVFLADGSNDLNIYAGDWWMANQDMLTALTWAGYEVNHAWVNGGHDSKHAVSILPFALKWLWMDYPEGVRTHKSTVRKLDPILEKEEWKELNLNQARANKLAVNETGEVFFADTREVYKIDLSGSVSLVSRVKGVCGDISFGKNGVLYTTDVKQRRVFAIGADKKQTEIIKNVSADFLTATSKGIYFSDASANRVGFYNFLTKQVSYVSLPGVPTGLAVSAEQTFITIGVATSRFGFSSKIKEDGSLDLLQEYVHYHVPYGMSLPDVKGMTVDSDNLLYTSTAMGIQLSDQLGRVNYIFSKPEDGTGDIVFGGADFTTLFTTSNGKLFSRKISAKGILSWKEPIHPPKPGL